MTALAAKFENYDSAHLRVLALLFGFTFSVLPLLLRLP